MSEQTKHPPKRRAPYSTALDRLKALQVQRPMEAGLYHDGGGLYLQVSESGSKSWLFRYRLHGRVRDMGLGSYEDFSLAEARERARQKRQLVADKVDPIDARDAQSLAAKAMIEQEATFETCAQECHKLLKPTWKNDKHSAQWLSSLETYAFPKLGNKKVHSILKEDLVAVLRPIWNEKNETASRVRQRIRSVLEWASANNHFPGYRAELWTDVAVLLGPTTAGKEHHAAAPYSDVGRLILEVRASASRDIAKLAFEFTVLTAARSGETRGALWKEIDWDECVWVIPPERMKAKKEHHVPLSTRCLDILRMAKTITGHLPLIFCHPESKKPFSDAIFTSMLHKGLGVPYTMHGFRSSFRDWGAEKTETPRELLEVALAHLPGDATEAAYWRGAVLERRLKLMEAWSAYATTLHEAKRRSARQPAEDPASTGHHG